MKILFCFFALLSCSTIYGQQVEIIYDIVINDPSAKWGTIDNYELYLRSDGNKSIEYRKDKDTLMIQASGVIYETKGKYYSDCLKFKRLKNLNKKIIKYTEYSGQVHVKDTIDIAFKKGLEIKTILGLPCNQLFFKFRGRHYEAYYTPEISIPDGPYKFIGAPGLILET